MDPVQEQLYRLSAEMDDRAAAMVALHMLRFAEELHGIATSIQCCTPADPAVSTLNAAADYLTTVADTIHARPALIREVAAQRLRDVMRIAPDEPEDPRASEATFEAAWKLLGVLADGARWMLKNKRDRQTMQRVCDIAARECGKAAPRSSSSATRLTLVSDVPEEFGP